MVTFEPLDDRPGVAVVDPVNRRRYALYTDASVAAEPASPETFRFPVDAAVEVTAAEIGVDQVPDVYVRDASGETVAEPQPGERAELPPDAYSVELSAPIKLYLRATGPLTVVGEVGSMRFAFGGETAVQIGARSYHTRPAATITTTDDPADALTAVSQFGSALKTTTVERSYPTLRGHPPTIERGDELRVPDELERPETGVRLELPATHRAAYVAAPLAYYLGAEVVEGATPRLVTDDGFEHALGGDRGFEGEVERVLKQVFFLDCLTRTEGLYRVDLHERAALEADLDLSFERLYDRPLAEQVEAYLDVPFDALSAALPQWGLAARVEPTPAHVEALPFLVDDLAVVRTGDARPASPAEVRSATVRDYLGRTDDSAGGDRGNDHRTDDDRGDSHQASDDESAADGESAADDESTSHDDSAGDENASRGDRTDDGYRFVEVGGGDAAETVWFGDGVPIDASKGVVRAFRNRLDRTPKEGDIDITVVCNDSVGGAERDVVDDVYGSRGQLPFDVTVHRDCSTAELESVLRSNVDLLHYIGHVDPNAGFRCRDGSLDAGDLDSVNVDAFVLNACRSYDQGLRLVDAGSIGGVVTFSDVIDGGAVTIGRTTARLLNLGFPLRAALAVAQPESIVGGQYIVVGDGTVDVAQDENGMPMLCRVTTVDDGYELRIRTFLPQEGGMGSMAFPMVEQNREHFLAPGDAATFRLAEDELREFLRWYRCPVSLDGELVWNERFEPPL